MFITMSNLLTFVVNIVFLITVSIFIYVEMQLRYVMVMVMVRTIEFLDLFSNFINAILLDVTLCGGFLLFIVFDLCS